MRNRKYREAALWAGVCLLFVGIGVATVPWMIGVPYTRVWVLLGAAPGVIGIIFGIVGVIGEQNGER